MSEGLGGIGGGIGGGNKGGAELREDRGSVLDSVSSSKGVEDRGSAGRGSVRGFGTGFESGFGSERGKGGGG